MDIGRIELGKVEIIDMLSGYYLISKPAADSIDTAYNLILSADKVLHSNMSRRKKLAKLDEIISQATYTYIATKTLIDNGPLKKTKQVQ